MRAILYAPDAPNGLQLADAPEPVPEQNQALVEVRAFSLNFADVAFLSDRRTPGDVVGFEAAGVVIAPAADGTGPAEGARVTGFGPMGGWAERRPVATDSLAELPDGMAWAVGAALPVAGVTALRAVRALGAVLGRRVLVTGASGGVGRMAVQLAARAGAHVVACVGSEARTEGLADAGAHEIVVGLGDVAPVDGVVELVGGALLSEAYALVPRGGMLLSVGAASMEPSRIDFEAARLRSGGRIESFNVFDWGPYGTDMPTVLDLAHRDALVPSIGWRGSWTQIGEAVEALRGRRVAGKAVLEVQ